MSSILWDLLNKISVQGGGSSGKEYERLRRLIDRLENLLANAGSIDYRNSPKMPVRRSYFISPFQIAFRDMKALDLYAERLKAVYDAKKDILELDNDIKSREITGLREKLLQGEDVSADYVKMIRKRFDEEIERIEKMRKILQAQGVDTQTTEEKIRLLKLRAYTQELDLLNEVIEKIKKKNKINLESTPGGEMTFEEFLAYQKEFVHGSNSSNVNKSIEDEREYVSGRIAVLKKSEFAPEDGLAQRNLPLYASAYSGYGAQKVAQAILSRTFGKINKEPSIMINQGEPCLLYTSPSPRDS